MPSDRETRGAHRDRAQSKSDSVRASLKELIGEVRVDRTGKGYAELCPERMVAGGVVRFRQASLGPAALPFPGLLPYL